MGVYALEQRRFEAAKQKVHLELVDYFVNLDQQKKLWYFTVAVNGNARANHFSLNQAEKLVDSLVCNYTITSSHIEAAVAFDPTRSAKFMEELKIVPLCKGGLLDSIFTEQLGTLYELMSLQILEFRQALSLVLVLLENYPVLRRAIG